MSAPPDTVLEVSPQEVEAIRAAVLAADLSTLGPGRSLAGPADTADLLAFLLDSERAMTTFLNLIATEPEVDRKSVV